MPHQNDAFDKRLQRLGASSGKTMPPQAMPAFNQLNLKSEPVQVTSGNNTLAALALAFFLVGGGAFGVMLLAPELIFTGLSTVEETIEPEMGPKI